MKTIEIKQKLLEEALDQLKAAQQDCYVESTQNIIDELELALRQPTVSGELNCKHDWLVDMYDHFGFPASRFCDKCNTREAI